VDDVYGSSEGHGDNNVSVCFMLPCLYAYLSVYTSSNTKYYHVLN